ncbi:hypothetical protein BDW02DRAFT_575204, partial [Decorospora gaudefroyi]
ILEEDARAFPLSYARAREIANRILRINGNNNPRNLRVALIIRAFLKLFKRTRVRLGIRTKDM